MKPKIAQIDRILAQINVSGDSVMLMANARALLKKLYDSVEEKTDAADRK